jgi:hypothetical protein
MIPSLVMQVIKYLIGKIIFDACIVVAVLWYQGSLTFGYFLLWLGILWVAELLLATKGTFLKVIVHVVSSRSASNLAQKYLEKSGYPKDVVAYDFASYADYLSSQEDLANSVKIDLAKSIACLTGIRQESAVSAALMQATMDKAVRKHVGIEK